MVAWQLQRHGEFPQDVAPITLAARYRTYRIQAHALGRKCLHGQFLQLDLRQFAVDENLFKFLYAGVYHGR